MAETNPVSGNGAAGQPRHNVANVDALYKFTQRLGTKLSRDEFHSRMDDPARAEKYLDNLIAKDAIKADDKKNFMSRIYEGVDLGVPASPLVYADVQGKKPQGWLGVPEAQTPSVEKPKQSALEDADDRRVKMDFAPRYDNVRPKTEAERNMEAEKLFSKKDGRETPFGNMLFWQEQYDAAKEEADRRRREVSDSEADRYMSEFVEPIRKEVRKASHQFNAQQVDNTYLITRAAEEKYADDLAKQYGVRRGLPHVLPYDEQKEHDPAFQKRVRETARDMSSEDAANIYKNGGIYKDVYDNYRRGKRISGLDEDASGWSRFWSGMATAFDGGSGLTLGLANISEALRAKSAAQRVQNGEGTEADKALVNSLLDRMSAEELYEPGIAGQIGQGTFDSLMFMLEMAITGGVGGAFIKGAKTIGKSIAKKAGREIAVEAAETAAKSGARRFVEQTGYNVAKGAVGSTVSPMVYSETLRRQNENYLFGRDENGEVTVREATNPESLSESFTQALVSNNISRLVELGVGPFLEKGVQAIAKPLTKITPDWLKFGNNFLSNLGKNVKDWMSVQGFLPETAEEFVEEILTRALVDQTAREKELGAGKWDDLFSPEWCKVTVGSVAVIQAAMGLPGFSASTANAAGNSARMRKYMRNLPDNLREEVGRIARMEDDNQRAQALSAVLKRSTDIQRKDILGYITARAANNLGLSFSRTSAQQQETEAYRQTLLAASMDGDGLLIAADRNGNRFACKPLEGDGAWGIAYPLEGSEEDGTLQIGKPQQIDMGTLDMGNAQEYTVSELLGNLAKRHEMQDEAQDTAIEQQEQQAAKPDADADKAYVAGHEFNYTDPKGNVKTVSVGSRIVPTQTVQAGESPNTIVSVAITKPGSKLSSPGVMTLSEFQNMLESGYVSVEEQNEGDTAADVRIDAEGNPVAEEEAEQENVQEAEPGVGVSETEEPAVSEATEEFDENGRQFVKSKDGSTTFGEVGEDSGLTAAPIRLSVGVDKVDEDGVHHGYGLAHIEAGHGEQIRNAGYATIEDFVEEVARNYTDIREGSRVAGTQTYLLEVSDKHNNTLFVQLSKNGEYWNVNSAGIFRKKYSRHKQKVSTVPAVGLGTNADVEGVNHGQSEGETVTSGNSPKAFEDKGTEVSSENQVRLPENLVAEKWNALVEDNEGDEAEALDTAMQMVGNKTAELEAARKTVTKGKSEEAIQSAKRAKRERISNLETELRFWKGVAAYPEKKRVAEEEAAKLNARLERERKRKEGGAVNPNYGLRQTEADGRLGAPLSLREYIIRKIATGRVKFLWGASESGTGGLKEHGGVAKRQMLYTDKAKGQYPEDVAEAMRLDIMDNHPEFGNVDADAILSEIENIAVGEQTPSEMMDEAERLHERSARFAEDDRQAEDMAPEADGAAADTGTPPAEDEAQDGKPRFAGEVFADEDWMRRDDSEQVPFQRTDGAATSPRATERQAKAIARQLKKLGLKGRVRIVDGVGELVKAARARLQSVFHGSPHGFKAFDFSHMGSGEGLQAYGWGGYVTEVEKIGRTYAEALSEKDDKLRENKIINDLARELLENNSKEEALSYLQSLLNESWSDKKRVKAQIKIIETGRFLKEPTRHLYHVEIPAEQDGNYLRWEDEVSEQRRNQVLDGLVQIEDDTIDAGYFAEQIEKYEAYYNLDGKALYEILSRFAFRSDKAASEFLSSLGFVGISYPAQYMTGGRSDGARNYVIFKESDMKITDHIRYEQDGNGEIAGATLPNGDVLLNRGAMRVDTPFHEFAHKLFTYAKDNRAASRLYDTIREYAESAPQEIKDYVRAHYPGLSEDAYLDEVFAWALSRQSEGGLEAFLNGRGLGADAVDARAWYEQVWYLIKDLWEAVRPMVSNLFGKAYADLSVFDAYERMGAEETGKALYDLMMGGKALPGAVETQSEATRNQQTEDAGLSDEERGIVERAKAEGTYLKAPNGKPTHLSPKQWAQVRTKAFKDWFGDWELANLYSRAVEAWQNNESKGKVVFGLSERAKARFNELLGNDVQQLVITDDAIRHIRNHHGTNEEQRGQKNMTPEDVVVIPYLVNNFDSMELNSEYDDKQGNRAIEIRKRINGVSVIATIEKGENKEFLVTSYQFVKSDALDASDETPGLYVRNDSDLAKVQNDIQKIKESAVNASKVVDENGEPLVVYHYTDNEFTIFGKDKQVGLNTFRNASDASYAATTTIGDWFTSNNNQKNMGTPMELFLNIRNPYDGLSLAELADEIGFHIPIDGREEFEEDRENTQPIIDAGNEFVEEVKNEGYDGVAINDEEFGGTSYVSFSPKQIKSATDNVGTFDAGNADIRFRFAGEMFAEPVPAAASVSASAKRQAAEALSRRLGVPVVIEDSTTPKGRSKRFAGVKGWFVLPSTQNPNGTIHVNVDNHASVEDVERTMLHEVVAHMGMRKMMGEEKYNALLDKVYESMDAAARAYFEDYAAKDFQRREGMTEEAYRAELQRIAADEYIAALAEVGADPSTWQKVVALVREALRALGFNLRLSDADIRALLYESKHNLESAAYSAERELIRSEQKEFRDEADLSNRLAEDERELDNIESGIEALQALSEGAEEVSDAMERPDLEEYGGTSGITFVYGQIGDADKKFKGGYGVSHIAAKHGVKTVLKAIDVIANGTIARYVPGNKTVVLEKDGYQAVLALTRFGEKDTWLLSGWKKEETAGDSGEVSTATTSTQTNPTFSREDLGAAVSSANIGNIFDNADDVRMRRAGTADDGRLGVISIDADKMGRYDKWSRQGMFRRASAVARYFLDDSLPLRHLMTHIKRSAGGVVSAATDLWRQSTMVVSRARFRIDEYNRKIGEPLMQSVRDIYRATNDMAAKYLGEMASDKKDKTYYIDLYLMAKHMPERNAWMAANRESGKSDYAGAEGFKEKTGMMPEEYVERFEKMIAAAGMDDRLKDMWRLINESTDFSLRQRVNDGLLGKDKYDEIMARGWQYYVPLRSWDENNPQSKDFADMEYPAQVDSMNDTFTNNVKRAEGRRSLADSPLAYIFRDAETSITLGETNRYRQAVAKLRDDNKNLTYIFGSADFLKGKETKQEENSHFVTYYENGQRKQVGFVNPMLAAAIRGDRERKRHHWMRPMQVLTRIQSALNTSLNPAFALTNAARDIQFGIYSRFVESPDIFTGAAASVAFIYELFRNLPAAVQASKKNGGIDGTGRNAQLIRAWRENGGETGWHTLNDLRETKDKLYKGITDGKIKNGTKEVLYAIPATFRVLTEISENAVRLAAFSDAKRRGLTDQAAASYSKEITTNFNRHSQFAQDIGPLYMFLNAQTQGIYRFLTLTKENPGNTAFAALGMMATGLFMSIGEALKSGGDDDDEKGDFLDRSEFIRFNNFIMGNFILPVAHNARMFFGLGAAVGDYIMGNSGETQLAYNLMQITGRELLPSVGNVTDWFEYNQASRFPKFNANAFLTGIAPSAVVPVVEAYANRNFMGSPIYYDESAFRPYAPRVARSKKDVNPFLLNLTEAVAALDGYNPNLNRETGYRVDKQRTMIPVLDWNASALEHILTSYAGGTGKFINDAYKLYKKWDAGEDAVKAGDVPILKSFVRPIDPDAALYGTYNRLLDQKNLWEAVLGERLDNITKADIPEKYRHMSVDDYVEMEKSMARSGLRKFEAYEEAVKKLAKIQNEYGDRSDEVNRQRKQVMRMANQIENSALREQNAPQADRNALLEDLRYALRNDRKRMIDAFWDVLLRRDRTKKAAE